MKIWIVTMEDPLYTVDFMKEIIAGRSADIAGITLAKGDRLKIGKKKSKKEYLVSLLLIMGLRTYVWSIAKTLIFKLKKKVNPKIGLTAFAEKYNIPVSYTSNPNSKEFLDMLRKNEIDVIINQSQFIIKKPFLESARLGVLNRHNALLPRNRGRLTPFWVLFHRENESGVSIHFVDEGIDSGEIVVQKRFTVPQNANFKKIVSINYSLAGAAMLEAIDKLEKGERNFLPNPDEEATYNTIPTLSEAWSYRKTRPLMWFLD